MSRTTLSFVLILALLSTSVVFGAGSAKKETPKANHETHYNAGVAKMEKGDWDGAAAKFAAALEAKEDFAEAHNNYAYVLRKQGADNFAKALEHYNRALELDPKLAQAYHYRGVLHVLAGDEASAKADHASLLKLDRELADELMAVLASGEEPEGHGGASGKWK
ncbi:MAG: tetratricopeptide repeat protein [Acidobacteriota bacterium]